MTDENKKETGLTMLAGTKADEKTVQTIKKVVAEDLENVMANIAANLYQQAIIFINARDALTAMIYLMEDGPTLTDSKLAYETAVEYAISEAKKVIIEIDNI
jgi:hypothetical protein